MKHKKKIWASMLAVTALSAHAVVVDWDKIVHWAGKGSNRAALVVQFSDNGPKEAYVWGFRWNDADFEGGTPSGEDMFRTIAAESNDLLLFTQYTGWMGCTVDGIGLFDPDGEHLASAIAYDFGGAKADTRISFDFFNPNTMMGQNKAPANFTQVYCNRAIENALTTNVIEHPINARDYGYPAYDYDWWQTRVALDTNHRRWNAGWYNGYWSYWVGDTDLDNASYSGLGYSSRKLTDGQVDGWKYTFLDGPVDGGYDGSTGASEQWYELNYDHTPGNTALTELSDKTGEEITAIYTTNGTPANRVSLTPGVYVVKFANGLTRKMLIK